MTLNFRLDPIGGNQPLIDQRKLFNGVRNAIRDQAADSVRYMQWYPPQIPTPYVRTGTLRKSWSFDAKPASAEIKSQANIAPYNTYVQGVKPVPYFDDRGWRNINDLEERINKDFPKRIQKEIDRAVGL